MIIASAQTNPKVNDIQGNIQDHLQIIKKASDHGAELLLFPELSLTSYERVDAKNLSFTPNDSRLDGIRKQATNLHMIIIAGAPVRMDNKLFIGAFIIYPGKQDEIYTKQFLHTGEDTFFSSSFEYNPVIELNGENIRLAICADIENPVHPENAYKAGCSLYLASIFYSMNSTEGAQRLLSSYAKKYSMNILMSNYYGNVWNSEAGGGSASWDKNGKMIQGVDYYNPGLLIIEKQQDHWEGKVIGD